MLLIPWYRSIFSSDTIFILPEELPLTFLIMQFSWWFSFNLKNSIFSLLFWKDFFTSYRIIVWWLSFPFFLSALQRCLFSYGLQIFWWEAGCHFICFYVVCLSDFIIFISAILLWGLYVRVFNVLLGVLWFPWICMVIIFIQLGKILLDIFSVPFFPPPFFFLLGTPTYTYPRLLDSVHRSMDWFQSLCACLYGFYCRVLTYWSVTPQCLSAYSCPVYFSF